MGVLEHAVCGGSQETSTVSLWGQSPWELQPTPEPLPPASSPVPGMARCMPAPISAQQGPAVGSLPSTLCAPGSQADTSSLWLCVLPSRLHTASVLSDTDASSICPEPSGVTLRGPRTHTLGNAEAASSYLGPPLSFLGLRTGPWSQGSDTWDPLLGELSPPWPAPGAPTLMAGRVDQRGPQALGRTR